jgi:serine/threonine protein kinase
VHAAVDAEGQPLQVVHCDLKPGNILLGPSGPLLADFGTAQFRDQLYRMPKTLTRGTPNYLAPEQARGGQLTSAVDVFAFGSTLYELCTNRRAFCNHNIYDVMVRISDVQSDDTDRRAKEVEATAGRKLASIFTQCHERNPANRPTASEIARWFGRMVRALRASGGIMGYQAWLASLERPSRPRMVAPTTKKSVVGFASF